MKNRGTAKTIYKKAQLLDGNRLQELSEFLDLLLQRKQNVESKEDIFPATKLEESDARTLYKGKPLTIEDMDNVISYEAELHNDNY